MLNEYNENTDSIVNIKTELNRNNLLSYNDFFSEEVVTNELEAAEISVGDYVLTGGELPAMVVVDSVSRYVNGVLSEGSTNEESFSNNLLEYPQYTRPENFNGKTVPEVLTSGNHQEIAKWRFEQSLITTYKKRPDLLTEEQSKQAEELLKNSQN